MDMEHCQDVCGQNQQNRQSRQNRQHVGYGYGVSSYDFYYPNSYSAIPINPSCYYNQHYQNYFNQYYQNYCDQYYQNYFNQYYQNYFNRPNLQDSPQTISSRSLGNYKSKFASQTKRNGIECRVCGVSFRSGADYKEHVQESHVKCETEGCDYSAPLSLLEVHRLRHVRNERGESILESAEETRKWIENRRRLHPCNRNRSVASGVDSEETMLERLLRETNVKDGREPKGEKIKNSVICPIIAKVQKQPSALIRLSDPLKYEYLLRRSERRLSPYSYKSTFGNQKTGKAKQRPKNNENSYNFIKNLDIPKRPPLLLHLLYKDIHQYQHLLINAIKAIVANNFFHTFNSF